jgi:hypothetical protein
LNEQRARLDIGRPGHTVDGDSYIHELTLPT